MTQLWLYPPRFLRSLRRAYKNLRCLLNKADSLFIDGNWKEERSTGGRVHKLEWCWCSLPTVLFVAGVCQWERKHCIKDGGVCECVSEWKGKRNRNRVIHFCDDCNVTFTHQRAKERYRLCDIPSCILMWNSRFVIKNWKMYLRVPESRLISQKGASILSGF